MNSHLRLLATALYFCLTLYPQDAPAGTDITILRAGDDAELSGDSLVSTAVAVARGIKFLELPINMSADDQLIVFKDTTLNNLTDVSELFPARHRNDGNYYVIDFSLKELRQLRLKDVFSQGTVSLSTAIPTLRDELALVRKLNTLLHKDTGLVISLQQPAFYTAEGKDMGAKLQQTLLQLAYGPTDKLYLQSIDPDELQKISRWPRADAAKRFALIQVVQVKTNNYPDRSNAPPRYQHEWLFTNSGLRILASYATAVALPPVMAEDKSPVTVNFLKSLRNYGISIVTPPPANTTETVGQQPTNIATQTPTLLSIDTPNIDAASVDFGYGPEPVGDTSVAAPSEQINSSEKSSTLPPFFSNLGLSPPKHLNKTEDSATEGGSTIKPLSDANY